MNEAEQDAWIAVCCDVDLDNERRRAAFERGRGNDNETLYPEEMTDAQRMSLMCDQLLAVRSQACELMKVMRDLHRGQKLGATFAHDYRREEQRAIDVLAMVDRALELGGID